MKSSFFIIAGLWATLSSTAFAQLNASGNVAANAGPSAAAFGSGQAAAAAGYQRSPGIVTPTTFTTTFSGTGGTGAEFSGNFIPWIGWNGGSAYWPNADRGAYLQGLAALQQSAGSYHYKTSAAEVNEQEALRRSYDNRLLAAQTYYEKRRLWQENQLRENPPLTMAQVRDIARKAAPPRLTSLQFEGVSGAIAWPALFDGDDFLAWRKVVNDAMRYGAGGVGSAEYHHIVHATQVMEQLLQRKIAVLNPTEYMQAKRFLQSLRYEAQLMSANDVRVSVTSIAIGAQAARTENANSR